MVQGTEIDVCDLVTHSSGNKKRKYRVEGYFKKIPSDPILNEKQEKTVDDFVDNVVNKIIFEEYSKEKENRKSLNLPCTRRFKLVKCWKEEATHLSLYGVCGAIEPIEECVKTGIVNWSKEEIQRARHDASRRLEHEDMFPIYEWE